MRIAIPVLGGTFCEHFGRCDGVYIFDVPTTPEKLRIGHTNVIWRPAAAKKSCESLPQWLKELGVTTVLAGGVGNVADHHFRELGIAVLPGHTGDDAAAIAADYLNNHQGPGGPNPCGTTLDRRMKHCRSPDPAPADNAASARSAGE